MFGMGTGVALSTQPPENFHKTGLLGLWSWQLPAPVESLPTRLQRPRTKDQRPNFSVAETRRLACKPLWLAQPKQAEVRATELKSNSDKGKSVQTLKVSRLMSDKL